MGKYCKKCCETKPLSEFGTFTQRAKIYTRGQCNACRALRERDIREGNPELVRERERNQYSRKKKANPEALAEYHRDRHLRQTFGITLADYNDMLEGQDGCCEICGITEEESPRQRFHVDHDHTTGEVRALLYHHCNVLLGHAKEDVAILEGAIDYLRRFK